LGRGDLAVYPADTGAAGLAAIWARENTREALFDAMKRKEIYATTVSRIKVRGCLPGGNSRQTKSIDQGAALRKTG